MPNVAQTSLAAYWSEKLGRRISAKAAVVLDDLHVHGSGTRLNISARTGMPINAVCGRVRELLDSKDIKVIGKVPCPTTLKQNELLELTHEPE